MDNHGGVLLIAEQNNNKVHNVTWELIGKAVELNRTLNKTITAVLFCGNETDYTRLLTMAIDKLILIKSEKFIYPDTSLYRINLAKVITKLKPEICLFGATPFGRSLAPRMAAYFNTGLTADCTGLEIDENGRLIQIRPAFSNNILAHIVTGTMPQMATIRYKEFNEACPIDGRSVPVEVWPFADISDNPENIKCVAGDEHVDITEFDIVVSAGAGIRKPQDMDMIRNLANLMGGTLGVSRQLVEQGFISGDYQVGYSGNRVKPRIYVAIGISGAPQHLAGMKDSGTIFAINSDPSAPIFNVADYGLVGDLYEIVPHIAERFNELKAANRGGYHESCTF